MPRTLLVLNIILLIVVFVLLISRNSNNEHSHPTKAHNNDFSTPVTHYPAPDEWKRGVIEAYGIGSEASDKEFRVPDKWRRVMDDPFITSDDITNAFKNQHEHETRQSRFNFHIEDHTTPEIRSFSDLNPTSDYFSDPMPSYGESSRPASSYFTD